MKKLIISAFVISALIVPTSIAQAATSKPKPVISGAAAAGEGTAAHEQGEGKTVEKKETGKTKKKVIKKKK